MEVTEFDQVIETIIDLEDAAEEMRLGEANQKQAIEADRAKAEDARKKAMESLGEHRKRKSSGEESKS